MSIQNARSNTSGNAPSSLKDGQIAISQADGIIFSRNVDGSIRRFLLPKRSAVSNAAYPVKVSDTYIGIASIAASRTITLPAAANYPAGAPLTIADESGSVTASVTISLAQAAGSSDTINGATNLLFTTPYFGATLFSDGVSKWTAIGLAAGGASGAALLYTPQLLTAAQMRQTLANLALSAADFKLTQIRAAAGSGSYLPLVMGLADGFADSSGIDTANAVNATVQSGAVYNQATDTFAKALLHFDGANGATSTSDAAGHAVTLTNATISTAQSKFGSASLLLGSTPAYAVLTGSSDFLLFGGDYTYECWVYPTTLDATTRYIAEVSNSTSDRWALYTTNGGNVVLFSGSTNAAVITVGGAALTTGSWFHIAVVRSGTTTTIYINGTSAGTSSANPFPTTGTPTLAIGGDNSGANVTSFAGYIDEARASKGIARYTANFTPPTSAFVYGTSGVLTLPSINYSLTNGTPTKGSIFVRAKATAGTIAPNSNFLAALSINGSLSGTTGGLPNTVQVTLAQTAMLPDGYAHYEANEVDLTGLAQGSILKGIISTVGTTLGVAIDGWTIAAR